jgi:NDP-sugar pyrophosphorylase family protein
MNEPVNCLILAAGLGERLRPITNHIPKPLLPILGKPVLQYVLEKVSALPFNKIGINLHYKKDAVQGWVEKSQFSEKIVFFPEDPILGTGGALKNAENFLGTGVFLIHNSDVISDIDLKRLLEYHSRSENLATLAVHDYPSFNNVAVDREGFVRGIGRKYDLKNESERFVAFTGIAVYSPEFLKFLPAGISSIVDTWLNVTAAGYRIGTMDVSGCKWSDIGTPFAYASAIIDMLKADGETVHIDSSVEGCRDIELDGYVVIEEGSTLNKASYIKNCIMLSGSKHAKGSRNENCILGRNYKIDLDESVIYGLSSDYEGLLIGTGGSDRKYFRIKKNDKTEVLMRCVKDDPDFFHYIEHTCFFRKYSIPVPELIGFDADSMTAVFEDLGDMSLYSWLKCPRDKEQIERIYERIMDILAILHTTATEHVEECRYLKERIFGHDYLRWETDYFAERFLKGIMNLDVKNNSILHEEFHRLALKVDSFHKTIIHRDFQSQNIMIKKSEPRIIDYQGARMAPPAYDVASILWDPYHRLKDEIREHLIMYYIGQVKHKAGDRFDEDRFMETLLPCRLQRHMQALGAYGFLSAEKGKRYFLKHIKEGLRLLKEDASLAQDAYPELHKIVTKL